MAVILLIFLTWPNYSIQHMGTLLKNDLGTPAEEGTESWGGHSEKLKIFLLQKLNSYGEP